MKKGAPASRSKFVPWEILSHALRTQNSAENLSTDEARMASSLTFGVGQIVMDMLRHPVSTIFRSPNLFSRYKSLNAWRTYRSIFEQIDVLGRAAPRDAGGVNSYSGAKALLGALKQGPMETRKRALRAFMNSDQGRSTSIETACQLALKTLDIPEQFDGWVKSETTPKVSAGVKGDPRLYMCLAQSPLTHENGYAHRSYEILSRLVSRSRDVTALQFSSALSGYESKLEGVTYSLVAESMMMDEDPLSYIVSRADILEARLSENPVGCLHAASNFMTGLPAALVSKRLKVPFIYEVRGFWELSRAANDPNFKGSVGYETQLFLETQTALMADCVIVLSAPIGEELISRGVPAEKIIVARNGASIHPKDQSLKPTADLTLGFIGSLTPYEGLDTLIEALKKMNWDKFPMGVRLIGAGAYSEFLKTEIRKAGLSERVIMVGAVPYENIDEAYADIDVIYSARGDTAVGRIVSPMKPLEALSYGKPILASDLPALTDLLETGRHVVYVDADNPAALISALENISGWSSEERKARSEEARIWVQENRSWDKTVDIIDAVYESYLP